MWNKYSKKFLKALPVAGLIIFIVLEILSRGAAGIFNKVVAEQKIFRGEVSVEKISANFLGEVVFTNFVWKDYNGNTMLEIPEGSLKVKIFDIVARNFKTSTIEEIFVSDANISLHFDEDMQIDFAPQSYELKNFSKKPAEKKAPREKKSEEEMKELKN